MFTMSAERNPALWEKSWMTEQIHKPRHSGECAYTAPIRLVRQNQEKSIELPSSISS
jgi:tRNA U34 5-methylaminomethyl-2-thiouridine-forming methyltransferase MnmC